VARGAGWSHAVQPWAMQHAEVRCGLRLEVLSCGHLALILALITLSVTSNDYISPDLYNRSM